MKYILGVCAVVWLCCGSVHAEEPVREIVGGDWTYPTGEQMAEYFPVTGIENDKGGRVGLDCTFHQDGTIMACKILEETPVGYGFGIATKAAFVKYVHVAPASVKDGLREGDHKLFVYNWVLH